MKKYTHEKAHEEIDYIFKTLLPRRGMTERPEQIRLCHSILNTMLDGGIALCDAGTGIGKTFAYLTAGILLGKCRAAEGKPQRPILISTSSIALQNAIQKEYLPLLSGVLLSAELISAPIEAVIRKGKAHYACDARLERRIRQVEGNHKNPAAHQALHAARHVLDLDQMRRRNLEHRLLQWLRSRPEPFPYPDQDILNIALHGDITPLPPEWNFQFLSWTWDEEKTRLLRGTEFENVPSISCGRSWKLLHMVGPEKPWRLPDAPGTMGQFHWILYSFFWWPEAKKLPAFRKELDAISQGLAPLLRRHIRGQQWKLFFSRGHIFRKRRDKIRELKKLLSILDGRKP